MMIKFKYVIIACILLCVQNVFSQGKTVTGLVTDVSGMPIPSATILVKGTSNGTNTDFDGKFTLTNVRSTDEIVFSFVGMSSQTVIIGNQTTINITLLESLESLNEVLIVGYGTKKRSLVTGAISSIDSKQIENSSSQRVEQVLQGKTSGVTVVSSSGSPGATAKVRIRGIGSNGNSDPLYIVDGMKVSSIDNISPNDIANLEVLKDGASTAIYGTQGANGVVIISTKQGKVGKDQISFSTQYTIQSLRTKMKLMNADQFVQYMSEAGQPGVVANGIDTNWLDETFEKADMKRYDLSFSGATEKTSYYISGSRLDQDGIVSGDNDNYDRTTLRVNLKSDVKEWLEVGINTTYSDTNKSNINEDNETRGVINNALLIDPLTPIYALPGSTRETDAFSNGNALVASDGRLYAYPTYTTGETINPVAYANTLFNGGTNKGFFLTSVYGKFKLFKNLEFTTRYGYEKSEYKTRKWAPAYFVSGEATASNYLLSESGRNSRWIFENFATYSNQFGNHGITALIGYSAEEYDGSFERLEGTPSEANETFGYINYATFSSAGISGQINVKKAMNSIFGRLSYDFLGKYLFEGSLRYDQSSAFPEANRGAVFPAVSAGWVISKEDFWDENSIINTLKIRSSWAQNGSDAGLDFGNPWKQFYDSSVNDNGVVYGGQSGLNLGVFSNPDLRWETSTQFGAGIDLRTLKNRLNFSMDYYKKETEDLITTDGNIIKTLSAGQNIGAFNVGTVENSGLEFELGYNDSTAGGLTYGVNLNFSTLKNEVTVLDAPGALNGNNIFGGEIATRMEEGKPLWYFYGYKTNGVDPVTGALNKADEKTMIGSPHPDALYGGSISLAYKNFDFNMNFQGTIGNDIMLGFNRPDRPITNHPLHYYTNRWTATNTNASFPSAANISEAYNTDLMIEDGSYMRIKQLQLGYSLPNDILEATSINKIRIYISLDDFFTFTKHRGIDPESGSENNNSIGLDKGFYPIPGKAVFGLSINL
ncbi:TonB-linked SusC/RagA family outer membrane protein [Tenacibaculum adriaticum]|uniref:TonB-linked SusC/RagA family outer membrane protein n=1 Tax=Tenacibaculum adriaticum TaxID=413713 RepID=A0A5S5DQM1_9FLAO|nr:TonB-dependent receptor [Tenacibaculum adriaticum]TYP98191.1 TonB-linked SusC/RagA family outer membrane protein [Tenacibaculum adriaticum]